MNNAHCVALGGVSQAVTTLQVQRLCFAYPGQAHVASDWSVCIGPGLTLLHGDTGSGKSTLLRCLAGELPAAGQLTLAGVRLETDRDAYRRQVFWRVTADARDDHLTARACTNSMRGGDSGFDANEWQTLVDGFALGPHLDKPLYMLSTGSKRKVWLAAALASGRSLVLLDEPSAALDAASIRCLRAALGRRAQRGDSLTIVASAEPIDDVAPAAMIAGVIRLPLG